MRTKALARNLLGFGVVLMLILSPLQAAFGQDTPDAGDETADVQTSDGTVDQGEPEAATEDGMLSQAPAVLSNQLFLPSVPSAEGVAATDDQMDAAFLHTWTAEACINVINDNLNRGLWDDVPGPGGANNEAGLLWFVTNDGLNEQCSYRSLIGGTGVAANNLRFRTAVNDNARFFVTLYRLSGTSCIPYLTRATSTTADDSQFRSSSFTFTTARICRVRIVLTDDPDTFNAAVRRSSVLIDYVRLYNGTTLTWQEGFTN